MLGEEFDSMLALAQQGDEEAFATLWRDLNPALLRYLSMGGDPADDVASDTWATVIQRLQRFRGDELAWRGWVFTTARRRAIDAGRRRARTARIEDAWESVPDEAAGIDPADVVAAQSDTDAALRLIAHLSPLQAEVVTLRVLGELPVEEVARIVGRNVGAVRVAAHRGLRRLEEILLARGVTHSEDGSL